MHLYDLAHSWFWLVNLDLFQNEIGKRIMDGEKIMKVFVNQNIYQICNKDYVKDRYVWLTLWLSSTTSEQKNDALLYVAPYKFVLKLDHMKHVNTAAERGILECQNQFSDVRWNCSATRERENDDIFGRISKIGKCSRLPAAQSGQKFWLKTTHLIDRHFNTILAKHFCMKFELRGVSI